MAQFKRTFASGSDDGGLFNLDASTLTVLGDAAGAFWPLIAGTVLLMILLARGDNQAVIPVGGGMILLQAWQSGMLN